MRNPRNDPALASSPATAGAQGDAKQRSRAPGSQPASGHIPERTCILTRRKAGKSDLIRLALSPDGKVAPDIRARAPGRGAWISVGKAELDAAVAKGKLKGALQRAFKTNDVQVPADLGERIVQALRQATLDRLGMEARSGNLINGADKVEIAARAGKIHLLIHAADAGEDGRKRLDQAWRVGGGGDRGLIFPEGRTILSMALGRENVVHLALTDRAAAVRVSHALSRWCAFNEPDSGLDGGSPALGTGSADERNEGTE